MTTTTTTNANYVTINNGGRRHHYWSSYQQYLEFITVEKLAAIKTSVSGTCIIPEKAARVINEVKDWSGGRNLADTLHHAKYGTEVTPLALNVRNAVSAKIAECNATVWTRDVTGEFVDVGAYLSNEPECMFTTITDETSKPTVNIVHNIGASAGVNASVLAARGTAILALCDSLAMLGYNVQLFIADEFRNGVGGIIIKVCDSDHPYDPNLASFALCSPAMLRKVGFAYYLTCPPADLKHWRCDEGFGYAGTLHNLPPQIDELTSFSSDAAAVFTEKDLAAVNQLSYDTCLAWVQSQLDRLTTNNNE